MGRQVASQPTRIASLLSGFSLEATRPKPDDFAALKACGLRGTQLYLSSLPGHPHHDLVEASSAAVAAGLLPLPHIAARSFATATELDTLLGDLAGRGVTRVLLVAGERDQPAGPYAEALDVLASGLLQRNGIVGVDVGGYPEGHPRIGKAKLDRALREKLELAERLGLAPRIVTQFSFDAAAVADWISRLRGLGISAPVRIGLAGPASFSALIRYAQRCGVRTSAAAMLRNSGLALSLASRASPDDMIGALAGHAASGALGEIGIHLFSFGGIAATANWAAHASTVSSRPASTISDHQGEIA